MSRESLAIPEGWSLQATKFHRGPAYYGLWIVTFAISFLPGTPLQPPAADVTYTLRRNSDGALKDIHLSGDHAPDALVQTLNLMEANASHGAG